VQPKRIASFKGSDPDFGTSHALNNDQLGGWQVNRYRFNIKETVHSADVALLLGAGPVF
jgi:hypothetical protein